MKSYKTLITILLTALLSSTAFGQIGRSISGVVYSHATVGTTAADAISAGSIDIKLKGWKICHDAGSVSVYLAVSDTVDPAVDGTRIAAGQCFECKECAGNTLKDVNVKGSAAATPYSVIQLK